MLMTDLSAAALAEASGGRVEFIIPAGVRVIPGAGYASLNLVECLQAHRAVGTAHWEETMTAMTRRSMLTGAAGAAALGSVGASVPAGAAAPAARQRARWYRYKVGSHEVTVVTDGARSFDADCELRDQRADRRGSQGARGGLYAARPDDPSLRADRDQHRLEARPHRYRQRPGRSQTKGELGQLPQNLAAAGIQAERSTRS